MFSVSCVIHHLTFFLLYTEAKTKGVAQNEKLYKLMNLLLGVTRIEYNMVGRVKACDDDL